MSRQLVLRVRFLDGLYHGRIDRGRAEEWPPAPLRLFQALLAGAAPRWFAAEVERRERPAFEWLEGQLPPTITTPPGRCATPVLTYVPNNNRGNTEGPLEKVRTAKTIEPMIFGADRVVEYRYALDPADAGSEDCARVICDVARHIRCLGWGIDLAVGSGEIVEDSGDNSTTVAGDKRITYRPADGMDRRHIRRVPKQGTLASLEAVYAGKLSRFAEAGTLTLDNRQPVFREYVYTPAPLRPFVAFRFIDENDDTVAYSIDAIKALAGHLRHVAAAACAGHIGEDVISGTINGHPAKGARLSILPTPSFGHANVDGCIRRVIFAEPFGARGDLCRLLGRVLDQQKLSFDGACPWPPSRLERIGTKDGVIRSYTTTETTWASVTPVLLPGFNRRSGNIVKADRIAGELLDRSLQHAGIAKPKTFEFEKVPYWSGTQHVRSYAPGQKLEHYPRFHVRLTFDRPMNGPLSMGAGRHVGFGILAATDGFSSGS